MIAIKYHDMHEERDYVLELGAHLTIGPSVAAGKRQIISVHSSMQPLRVIKPSDTYEQTAIS